MEKIEENCVLCCRKIMIYGVGVCDHPVCYECSARMRVLCKQNECPICRQDMPKVVFTQKLELFSTLSRVTYPLDRKYKIYFEDDICRRMYDKLLEHICKLCPNKPYFHTFGHLKHHMRRTHERFYCDLCVENLRIFTSERKCYTREGLARHRRVGDLDDTSHRGHPLCEFCDHRYLDQDELFRHLRREHFFCHFCDADGDVNKFYSDYEYLRAHFRREHYLCEEGACQDEKFTPVFRSEIDLKAHRALQHSKNLSKAQAKQARTLELEFTIKPRSSQQNGYISLTTENFRRQENQRYENQYGSSSSTTSSRERNNIRSNTSSPKSRNGCINASSLNTRSEEEFPRLTPSISPAHSVANLTNKTKTNSVIKDTLNTTKYQNKPSMASDDFPALGSSSSDYPELQNNISSQPAVDPHPQKAVLFHFNSQNCRKNSTNLCIKMEKHKDVNVLLGANNFNSRNNTNSNIVVPSKKDCSKFEINNYSTENVATTYAFPDKTLIAKKTFEEDFPQLCNADQQTNASLIMPTNENKNGFHCMVNSNESYQPFIMVKCKSKKKKQKSLVGMEVRPKEMHPSEPNIKTKETSALTLAQLVNTDIFDNQEGESMPSGDKELNKYENEKDDIVKELERQTENLVVDNDSNRKVGTPPGFSSASSVTTVIPPPGFIPSNSENSIIPPADSLSSIARRLTTNSHAEVQDVAITHPIETQFQNHIYIEPPDFQHRNVILIQQIQKLLDGNSISFAQFKSLSGHFRQSSITAEDYYKECLEILGKDGFLKVIPELLVLLPDINKQQDLLSILKIYFRNKSENSGAVPKGSLLNDNFQFEVCATCKQVLSRNDFENHKNNAHLTKVELNS